MVYAFIYVLIYLFIYFFSTTVHDAQIVLYVPVLRFGFCQQLYLTVVVELFFGNFVWLKLIAKLTFFLIEAGVKKRGL